MPTRRVLRVALHALLLAGGVASAQEQAERTFTVRGTIVDTAGRSIPKALVYLSVTGVFGVTDNGGGFLLSGIRSRVDTLHVRGAGFLPRSFRVNLLESLDDTVPVGTIALGPGPLPTLTLTVTLQDTLRGEPVAGAEVLVNDRSVGETDAAGVVDVAELPIEWGINVVLARRSGYAPLVGSIWVVEPHVRESLTGVMQPLAVDLPAIEIAADRITFSYDRLADFRRRQKLGWGQFFTRNDVERTRASRTTDLLRTIPWLSVESRRIVLRWAGQECDVTVWIDGSPMSDSDVDAWVHPADIAAMEVYREFGRPVEFSRLFSCGAIVIWTR